MKAKLSSLIYSPFPRAQTAVRFHCAKSCFKVRTPLASFKSRTINANNSSCQAPEDCPLKSLYLGRSLPSLGLPLLTAHQSAAIGCVMALLMVVRRDHGRLCDQLAAAVHWARLSPNTTTINPRRVDPSIRSADRSRMEPSATIAGAGVAG
jgi:hypothetical protein